MRNFLLDIIGLWIAGCLSLSAQESFTDTYQKFRPYHYQTPQAWNRIRCEVATHGKVGDVPYETELKLDEYITRVPEGFDNEVDSLTAGLKRSDLKYTLIPYWMTDVYLGLPPEYSSRMERVGYVGYVINPVSGMPELTNNWNSPNIMDFYPYSDKRYDLVAYCGDAISINRFLANADACRRFVYTVFNYPSGMINREQGIHKPSGLNVYLADFDFSEKRSLTQFVKSLSLVIDSFRVAGQGHVYERLDLSLTFSQLAAARHAGFIAGLQCFVDTVYFADFDSVGLARKVIYNDGSIDTSTMVTKISNPFYLFRIPFKTIQPGVNDDDIWELADCDYASGQWGIFFCIGLCLLLVMGTVIVLRYMSVSFNMYLERYHTFIVLAMITIVIEWSVFFFFMIEALSPQVIYFDLETGSMTYLALIALPVLPILLYFLILRLNRNEQLP